MRRGFLLILLLSLISLISCAGDPNESSIILYVLVTFLSIILSIIFFSSFIWALKYRNVKSEKGVVIVPETFSQDMKKFTDSMDNSFNMFSGNLEQVQLKFNQLNENFIENSDLTRVLKESNLKLQEILKRHEERWDLYNNKRFFKGLIKAFEFAKEQNDKSAESLKSQLEAINYELQNLIELSEIVEFKPDEDSKFSKAKGVSDKFIEKDTSDLNKVGKIAEIISPGYKINRLDSSDDEIIIKESIVSVYVNKNEINDKLGENNE
tara:strand:- start:1326 stop:2123 length:798 start_codon:yes stop_codon:yes gene_type:complete